MFPEPPCESIPGSLNCNLWKRKGIVKQAKQEKKVSHPNTILFEILLKPKLFLLKPFSPFWQAPNTRPRFVKNVFRSSLECKTFARCANIL